uniref:Succinate:cytochrome c oxidoreductase subunit 3 n=1 Tax=Renouxia sp. TaxID=2485823 RepID=A0A3G3MID9_9FLOR|nr:succinate:cytochrome c oxidoreductase subunit 3 [Renouxia sp.]
MLKIRSRPLSPHLTIYMPQLTSVFSIWHRITGVLLVLTLNYVLFLIKMIIYFPFNLEFNLFLDQQLNLPVWIINALFINLSCFFLYHFLNGVRHMAWDLGFLLSIEAVHRMAKVISFILFLFIINLIIKILN